MRKPSSRDFSDVKLRASMNSSEKIRVVAETVGGVVKPEWIDGLHFETADASLLHQVHFAFEFGFVHRRAKTTTSAS